MENLQALKGSDMDVVDDEELEPYEEEMGVVDNNESTPTRDSDQRPTRGAGEAAPSRKEDAAL